MPRHWRSKAALQNGKNLLFAFYRFVLSVFTMLISESLVQIQTWLPYLRAMGLTHFSTSTVFRKENGLKVIKLFFLFSRIRIPPSAIHVKHFFM